RPTDRRSAGPTWCRANNRYAVIRRFRRLTANNAYGVIRPTDRNPAGPTWCRANNRYAVIRRFSRIAANNA
ncbi:hypothetical protein FA519_04545, partial [Pseudomonas aeruginosa]|nr:hypothetical protein [Pseudomonas aeruginosa]